MPEQKENALDDPGNLLTRFRLRLYGLLVILGERLPEKWVFQSGRSSPPLKGAEKSLMSIGPRQLISHSA